jgi:hypothetical protein
MLKAMTKMLRGKYDAFERAFRIVRTMVGEQNFNFTLPARELSHGRGGPKDVGIKPKARASASPSTRSEVPRCSSRIGPLQHRRQAQAGSADQPPAATTSLY